LNAKINTRNNDTYRKIDWKEFSRLTETTQDNKLKTINKIKIMENFRGKTIFFGLFKRIWGTKRKKGIRRIKLYATSLPLLIPKPSNKKAARRKKRKTNFKYLSIRIIIATII
jgi:hypothetical protein